MTLHALCARLILPRSKFRKQWGNPTDGRKACARGGSEDARSGRPQLIRSAGSCDDERRELSRRRRADLQKLYRKHHRAKTRALRHTEQADKATVARAESAEAVVQTQGSLLAEQSFAARCREVEVNLLRVELDRTDSSDCPGKDKPDMEARVRELESVVRSLRRELMAVGSESASIVRERLTIAKERLYWTSMMEECSYAACRLLVQETFEKSFEDTLREEGAYPFSEGIEEDTGNISVPLKVSDLPTTAMLEERAERSVIGPKRMQHFISSGSRILQAIDPQERSVAWNDMSQFGVYPAETSIPALRLAVERLSSLIKAKARRARAACKTHGASPVASWVFGHRSHAQAYREHGRIFGQLSVNEAGCCGLQLTQSGQYRVLKRLFAIPRLERRVLEVGYALGYLIAGALALGANRVVGVEVKKNSGVLRQLIEPHPQIILVPMDVLDLKVEDIVRSKFTTVMCLVGTEDVTRHIIRSFLTSPYLFDLAYLMPSASAVARAVWTMLEQKECLLAKISVQLAGSSGRGGRTIVVAQKRQYSI